MRTTTILCSSLLVALLISVLDGKCQAQGMFGQRELGRSVSKRPGPQSSGTGVVDSSRRFLRDQRDVTDFVGSVIAQEAAGSFVGGQSAAATAVSSTAGLTEETRPILNRPRVLRPAGLYAPRLRLTEDTLPPSTTIPEITPLSSALQSLMESRGVTIEVSPADHSATLRGAVPSEHDRQTTELLVKLEPGIRKVENELIVDSSLPPLTPTQRRSRLPK